MAFKDSTDEKFQEQISGDKLSLIQFSASWCGPCQQLKPIIEKIVKLQHNRGPDDNDIWESKNNEICFGHNRLAIIDLSKKGRQPFISSDGNFVITFNGEIYNF